MFARALLDGDGLISPGRTTARINPARVLQQIRLGAGALHLNCFTVLEIWHRPRSVEFLCTKWKAFLVDHEKRSICATAQPYWRHAFRWIEFLEPYLMMIARGSGNC